MEQKKSEIGTGCYDNLTAGVAINKCEFVVVRHIQTLSHQHFHALNIISTDISLFKFRCQCGNCDLHFLQNISECYYCSELEGCVEALTSDAVLQDLSEEANLTCITQHPGFNPVCLQKWSLRLASHKYKTKGKKKYAQTGSEER